MEADDLYYGVAVADRQVPLREELRGGAAVISFLKASLFKYREVAILISRPERCIFRAVDGVDLYSELRDHGIDLPQIYADIRAGWVARSADPGERRESWEDAYDEIGFSAGEIAMRQRAKRAARRTTTVAEVAAVLEGTYFNAHFETEDGQRQWGYFDRKEMTVTPLQKVGDGWQGEFGKRVALSPAARVEYLLSGEDVHSFVLLDPPE
jgi:hypothetical protein